MFANGLYEKSFLSLLSCPWQPGLSQILPLQPKPARSPAGLLPFPLACTGIQHRAQIWCPKPDGGCCSKFLPWLNLPPSPSLPSMHSVKLSECSWWIEGGLKEQ